MRLSFPSRPPACPPRPSRVAAQIIYIVYCSAGSLFYFKDINLVYVFVTNCILSFCGGLFLHLVTERPAIMLERCFRAPSPKDKFAYYFSQK